MMDDAQVVTTWVILIGLVGGLVVFVTRWVSHKIFSDETRAILEQTGIVLVGGALIDFAVGVPFSTCVLAAIQYAFNSSHLLDSVSVPGWFIGAIVCWIVGLSYVRAKCEIKHGLDRGQNKLLEKTDAIRTDISSTWDYMTGEKDLPKQSR
jgi:uncharacterized membrane protein